MPTFYLPWPPPKFISYDFLPMAPLIQPILPSGLLVLATAFPFVHISTVTHLGYPGCPGDHPDPHGEKCSKQSRDLVVKARDVSRNQELCLGGEWSFALKI